MNEALWVVRGWVLRSDKKSIRTYDGHFYAGGETMQYLGRLDEHYCDSIRVAAAIYNPSSVLQEDSRFALEKKAGFSTGWYNSRPEQPFPDLDAAIQYVEGILARVLVAQR